MSDKIYEKLNKRKPPKSVLESAYTAMDEEKRATREARNPRRWIYAVAGSVCSIIVIVFVVIIAINGGLGFSKSEAPSYDENRNYSADKSGNIEDVDISHGGLAVYPRNALLVDAKQKEVTVAETLVTAYVCEYELNGTEIKLFTTNTPIEFTREYAVSAGVLDVEVGVYIGTGTRAECAFVYKGRTYYMIISSVDRAVVADIIAKLDVE